MVGETHGSMYSHASFNVALLDKYCILVMRKWGFGGVNTVLSDC